MVKGFGEQSKIIQRDEANFTFKDIQKITRITVNGNDCGIIWTPPYKLNIT